MQGVWWRRSFEIKIPLNCTIQTNAFFAQNQWSICLKNAVKQYQWRIGAGVWLDILFYFCFFALCLGEDIAIFVAVRLRLESCLDPSCKILNLSLSVGHLKAKIIVWIPVIVTVTFYWENAFSPWLPSGSWWLIIFLFFKHLNMGLS